MLHLASPEAHQGTKNKTGRSLSCKDRDALAPLYVDVHQCVHILIRRLNWEWNSRCVTTFASPGLVCSLRTQGERRQMDPWTIWPNLRARFICYTWIISRRVKLFAGAISSLSHKSTLYTRFPFSSRTRTCICPRKLSPLLLSCDILTSFGPRILCLSHWS